MSSGACQKVLDNRGISVHFLIDNDGTIYQTIDMQHGCWHAGSERANRASVGVEISNAYYPKYQDWYVRNGHGERPMIEGVAMPRRGLRSFHGFLSQFKLEPSKQLWKAIHKGLDIPYNAPLNQFDNTATKYVQDVKYGDFRALSVTIMFPKTRLIAQG